MDFNPEVEDSFYVYVWSDSDIVGIDLSLTETYKSTGIFEGTVFFTTIDESSGDKLRVAEGDTITSQYVDSSLPDPYTITDELEIIATTYMIEPICGEGTSKNQNGICIPNPVDLTSSKGDNLDAPLEEIENKTSWFSWIFGLVGG